MTTALPAATRPAWRAVWVLALAWIWLGCTAPLRTLFLPDEGRYVGVAWEMVHASDWLTPTLDGLPFFHKPPLFYWLSAAALQVFGPVEWAARLPGVAAAGLLVLAVHAFVARWQDAQRARWAAIVLASQPMFFIGAQFANLDLLVAACIGATVLLGAHAVWRFEAGRPDRPALAAAYAGMALGVLAKGLIGLVLPGAIMLVWLALARRWRSMRHLWWWPGWALFALIAVPWLAAMQHRHPDFLHYFIVVQHVQRFAQSGFNSVEPWWFYIPVLVVFLLPWSPWLLLAVRRPPAGEPHAAAPTLRSLAWTWLAVVVLFFSLPQSKLLGYILPALAPIALLIVDGAAAAWQAPGTARRLAGACAAIAPVVCVGAILAYAGDDPKSSRDVARALAAARAPGEAVAVLDEYPYDLMFYLRDVVALQVVTDWNPAEVAAHDDWRRELADAGAFAPDAARDRLRTPEEFRRAVCSGALHWIIGRNDQAQRWPFLVGLPAVARHGERSLWHVVGTAGRMGTGCPGG